LQQLAEHMRRNYVEASHWWENTGSGVLQEAELPDDLTDDADNSNQSEAAS